MAVMTRQSSGAALSLRHAARLLATTALTAPLMILPALAQNLPTGASVAAGSVAIAQPSATQMTITQSSQSAVVNYSSFSIGAGHAVNIAQPSVNAALLNRVTGDTPSSIAGSLTANGQVYLVNPNGIAITRSGVVNVGGGFVASTLGISDSDFMSGKRTFSGNGASAGVSNAGTIRVGRGGYAALIGGTVDNSGSIEAPLGKVGLGSGEQATLDFAGDGFLQVAVPTRTKDGKALVTHSGRIKADGGSVVISAATAREAARNAVNLSGHVQARSISGHSGSIVIGGGAGGVVKISGKLSVASRKAKGGKVTVTGRDVALAGATIDASGKSGGGEVRIGGDWQGTGSLQRAETTSIDARTAIKADARDGGNGGKVVVWSDQNTRFAGHISAKGGARGGNGGDAEVSGKAVLGYTGFTDLSAPNGNFGTLLLDPYNVIISSGTDTLGAGPNFTANADDSVINADTLMTQLGSASVTVSTGGGGGQAGDITVAAPITWSSGAMLTLDAYHSIAVNAPMTITGGGKLNLTTNNGGSGGTLSFAGGVQFTGTPGSGQSLTINGQSYTLLYDMAGVQDINANLTGHYALAKSLDASGIPATGPGQWIPLGTDGANFVLNGNSGFTGTFTGLGNTISNLTIDIGNNSYAGLFGYVGGAISDIGLVGGSVTAGSGSYYVGGLVGLQNPGATIARSYATGTVTGIGSYYVGGLVGWQFGAIEQSYATGAVTGGYHVGGLVGGQDGSGSITQAYATGEVTGVSNVGGLVGYQPTGSITQAYATGAVTGTGNNVGGLVGQQGSGSITQAYASGLVTGAGSYIGGLVGYKTGGTIAGGYFDSWSTGRSANLGVGNVVNAAGVTAVSSMGGGNTAYQQSAYSNLTFTTTPGGSGWYMIDGQTRPFGAWEYSTAVTNGHQLQLVNMAPAASYTVARDIDLAGEFGRAGVASPNSAQSAGMWNRGFVPLGTNGAGTLLNSGTGFTGAFDGLGHAIANLIVDIGANNYAGLFGYTAGGVISDINLAGGSVKGGSYIGGLVGYKYGGGIARATASVTATGSGNQVGGLVGIQGGGTITESQATGEVNGAQNVGGLVGGQSNGTITDSRAAGKVSGGYQVGGLAGFQIGGSITGSHAIGEVNGDFAVGGLVGQQSGGTIADSSAEGKVTASAASNNVGGLVGWQEGGGSITNSHATGEVSGRNRVGGLVGWQASGTITDSVAEGDVTGAGDNVGGLVGYGSGGITNSHASGDVKGTGASSYYIGGLVGWSSGTITDSSAEGDVTGTGDSVGGLVGRQDGGGITDSSAEGKVSGNAYVGGLVGWQANYAAIATSYAIGEATGGSVIGGLVGYQASGTITDSHASGAATSDSGGYQVGGLVGRQDGSGSIARSHASGDVSSTSAVGGLVGRQDGGSIMQSYASGVVTGDDSVGGLVGYQNGGSITGSHASGAVEGGGFYAGGLVGYDNYGSIGQSYASGAVTGSNAAGGLVGYQYGGNITQTYATGAVTGIVNVGGLVGSRSNGGGITQSYATGAVTGGTYVGGLVGYQYGSGITQAYATGAVAGGSAVGGLVGYQYGSIVTQVYATGAVTGTGSGIGGLVGISDLSTVTAGYFDTETTGRSGVGGLTTAQLQAALPAGFDPAVWGILPGVSYPYFAWRFPDGPSVVSGKAIDIAGGNGRLGVGLGVDGAVTAYGHTGANGYYNFMVDPAAEGSTAVTWLTGERFAGGSTTSRANAVGEMPGFTQQGVSRGLAGGLDLYADTVNIKTALPTFTDIATMMERGLYGDGTGAPLYAQVPDPDALLYDACGCGASVAFDPGVPGGQAQASVLLQASAPLLTWDGVFDSVLPPMNATILAAGDVVVTSGNGIGADDFNGGGLVTMVVNGGLTLQPDSGIAGGAVTMTVKGDLTLDTDAALFALTGGIDADVDGNISLGGASTPFPQMLSETIRLSAGGDFTMAPNTYLAALGTGDAIRIAVGGKFDNQTVPDPSDPSLNALVVDPDQARWLVYLNDPNAGHNFGGLDSQNTAVWNTGAFATVADSGNRYVFDYQPVLTFTSDNVTKTYGTTGALTYTVTGLMAGVTGAYLGDTAATAYSGNPLLSSAGVAPTASVAGSPYLITIADNGMTSPAGYDLQFVSNGRLTVTPAALTITANDAAKSYGQTVTFAGTEFTTSALQNGESVSSVTLASLGAAATAGIGGSPYAITASNPTGGGFDAANYAISYVDGRLTVTPAALIVTADAQSRLEGAGNPPLTYRLDGTLFNNDTIQGALATAATVASPPGAYPITQGSLNVSANYVLTYRGALLTIVPGAGPTPAPVADAGSWASNIFFDGVKPVVLPDNARPVFGMPNVVTALGIGVLYADPRFEQAYVCFGGGNGTAQVCFAARS